jgi:hypothetical protein
LTGVSDTPETFEGLPVAPNPGPKITMDYMPIPNKNMPYDVMLKQSKMKIIVS